MTTSSNLYHVILLEPPQQFLQYRLLDDFRWCPRKLDLIVQSAARAKPPCSEISLTWNATIKYWRWDSFQEHTLMHGTHSTGHLVTRRSLRLWFLRRAVVNHVTLDDVMFRIVNTCFETPGVSNIYKQNTNILTEHLRVHVVLCGSYSRHRINMVSRKGSLCVI